MQKDNCKILAIDNKDNLTILKKIIPKLLPNTKIITTINGKKGINLAKAEDPDVILLGIFMPSMQGIEICKLLKADQYLKTIPVLFMADKNVSSDIRLEAIKIGGEAFLFEPFDPADIKTQIQAMVKTKKNNLKQIQKKFISAEPVSDTERQLKIHRKTEKDLLLTCRKLEKIEKGKSFIIDCQKQLLEMDDINKVYYFVGEKIKELIGNGYTVISALNEKTEAFNIAAYYGFDNKITELLKILKKDPRKKNFYIKDIVKIHMKMFTSGRLEKYENGIYILLNKYIPKSDCSLAEEFLKIKYVYAMGFVSCDQYLGELVILTKNNIWELKETIEIIVNQAALTILRLKSEEKVKKSEERYKSIFDQSPFGIAIVNSNTRIIYNVNQKFADIIGRTIDECTNLDWLDITHPDDIQEDLNNMAMFNAGKLTGYNMNKRYIKPDNSIVWINMTITQIKVIGEYPCHLCMIEDITEKKRKRTKNRIFILS